MYTVHNFFKVTGSRFGLPNQVILKNKLILKKFRNITERLPKNSE